MASSGVLALLCGTSETLGRWTGGLSSLGLIRHTFYVLGHMLGLNGSSYILLLRVLW